MPEESVPQLPRGCLETDTLLARMPCDVVAVAIKLEPVPMSETTHELLIRLRIRTSQLVIEVNNRKDDPQLVAQLNHHTQQRDRIDAAGNSNADPLSRHE